MEKVVAESLGAVHTHTHTHTLHLENEEKGSKSKKSIVKNVTNIEKIYESEKVQDRNKNLIMLIKNRETGITLIALVITIIVLLILAGVSISMLTGSNGILTQANKAKELTEISGEKEGMKTAVLSIKATNSDITEDNLKTALDNQFGVNKTTIEDNKDGSYTVKMNNESKREYTVEDDGSLLEGTYSKWDGTTSTEPTNKTSNEIHIYTAPELKWLADQVNNQGNTFEGYTIYLENNLDLGGRAENGNWETTANESVKWTAIGKIKANPLKATFEGNNHIIKDVYVNSTEKFDGIFGNSNSISNLTIKNSYIKGAGCNGAIVGACRSGAIENCHNINTTVIGTDRTCGGIAGQTNAEIKNCSNSGKITFLSSTSEHGQVGGVIGLAYEKISGCYNTGDITCKDYRMTGGVVGCTRSKVEKCYNTGKITGGIATGGVAGAAANIVTKCYNIGKVIGEGDGGTGGIVGDFMKGITQDISLCYNSGTVQGVRTVGGISGYLGAQGYAGKETKCYNKGNVICTTNSEKKGEIVGSMANDANVTNCYFYTNDDSRYGVGVINSGGSIETQRAGAKRITNNFNSLDEFITWVEQQ